MLKKDNNNKIIGLALLALLLLFSVTYFYHLKIANFLMNIYSGNLTQIDNENFKLSLSEKEELEKLRVENSVLKLDMKDLKKEINLIEDGLEPTYVKMLGKEVVYYGSFYITYPKNKTVYKGMNVYSHGNVLVGQVEDVLDNSLFVTRLGQNKSFFAESQDTKEQLELSSIGGGQYTGQLVSGSKISVGDNIVLKGYPRAFVGMVSEIVKNENSNSTIFVRTPYNIYEKEIFYVLQ